MLSATLEGLGLLALQFQVVRPSGSVSTPTSLPLAGAFSPLGTVMWRSTRPGSPFGKSRLDQNQSEPYHSAVLAIHGRPAGVWDQHMPSSNGARTETRRETGSETGSERGGGEGVSSGVA